MHKFLRLFNTVKYLKPIQVYYRLYYFARSRLRKLRGFKYPLSMTSNSVPLTVQHSIASYASLNDRTFVFLNLSHTFENGVDWNFSKFGKLWTYNLTYFDYLQQEQIAKEDKLFLINDFIIHTDTHKDALEPFPISLRGINWVKFLSMHSIKEKSIDDSLYAQYNILMDTLEYHLLGNHLLENGFSLLFGAYYFQDERLYSKAKEILTDELTEQILDDGSHFELSPMYHQIMLFRLLDCINLVKNNNYKNCELLSFLETKAKVMWGWLKVVTFSDGSIPLFNDSAKSIAPTTEQLNRYAIELKINSTMTELGASGYRKYQNSYYEAVVDVGHIGPDYIPGHAHADTFGFELYLDGKPFIVDSGLSTYETNTKRTEERSTAAHNTVEVDGLNQSEVWDGFRVANRAYVTILHENDNIIKAVHDGYKKRLNTLHEREFIFENDSIRIIDKIISDNEHKAFSRIHFHPNIDEGMIKKHIMFDNSEYTIKEYQYSPEFNVQINAKVLEISFTKKLEIKIIL